jgi:large subunit ribosomal protein L10
LLPILSPGRAVADLAGMPPSEGSTPRTAGGPGVIGLGSLSPTSDMERSKTTMPTQAKAGIIQQLVERLRRMRAAVLLQTQGMTVAEMTDLRRKLSNSGIDLQVAKNTLLRIASEQAELDNFEPILHGQTTIALGYGDEVAVAKAIADYTRTTRTAHPVTVKAGILGRTPISASQVEALARTPPRDQLRAEVVGALQGPLSQTYGVVSAPLRDLVNVLEARIRQLGGAETA